MTAETQLSHISSFAFGVGGSVTDIAVFTAQAQPEAAGMQNVTTR